MIRLALAIAAGLGPSVSRAASHNWDSRRAVAETESPAAHVANGTYLGVRNEQYSQDFFLGIPYAQPPTGALRFAAPQALTEAFDEPRTATEYSLMCIGYGSDTSSLGNPISEDCLTLNVVRPAGVEAGDDLPVGVWVHGGVRTTFLPVSLMTDFDSDCRTRATSMAAHGTPGTTLATLSTNLSNCISQ